MKIKTMKNKMEFWAKANRMGLFLVVLFLVCFLWFYLRPVEKELHEQLLRLSFFGFSGMNLTSFIFGLIQSYVWGYVFVGLWQLVARSTCRCK